MAIEIYIVSGFLGAGKTTLIQKLLKEAFHTEKVVLIENDFGEISVDAALLKTGGIEVKEINSGCICCSLSGDFVRALKELGSRFRPDKIIIEPSGVGKLSDIVKACSDPNILPFAKVKAKITVVDVKRCKIYLDNFGEFFEDQIQNANVILLSRTENFPDKVNDAYRLAKSLNTNAAILSKPWNQITVSEILSPQPDHHEHTEHCGPMHGCSEHDEHGHSGYDCDCGQNHSAQEAFDTVTIRTKRMFSIGDLRARVANMERSTKGIVLRAKGVVRGPSGYINLQYIPGDIQITSCTTGGDMLCIIGRNLNRQELVSLFTGE
ncbi:MAG: GTP-binding protein [Syntrophomonadaceae bacterium]|nr:GTP-binding protein [Syntrophomonadaceae bacterium]